MKQTDKITHDIIVELLNDLGLEYNGKGTFWCCDSEQNIESTIKGNTLKDLLQFIKKYYYDMGYQYGRTSGRREKIEEIRKAFQMD